MLLKEKNYVVTLTDPEIKTIADSLQNDCVSMRSRIEELLLKKRKYKRQRAHRLLYSDCFASLSKYLFSKEPCSVIVELVGEIQ